jgi:hypothetical protein
MSGALDSPWWILGARLASERLNSERIRRVLAWGNRVLEGHGPRRRGNFTMQARVSHESG